VDDDGWRTLLLLSALAAAILMPLTMFASQIDALFRG
jgi:hypothetical protein